MDAEFVHEALGDEGLLGVVLLITGVVAFGRENRKEGLGALAVAVGGVLVNVGLLGGFLRAMNMEFEDLL